MTVTNMRKIISAAVLAPITPAFGADIEPKAAVDCFLSICLPAMEDLANVSKMGPKSCHASSCAHRPEDWCKV
jgi:hypothetical protein